MLTAYTHGRLYTAASITIVFVMRMHLLFSVIRGCFRVCLKETGSSNTVKGSEWREGMHRLVPRGRQAEST
jgi:hypothetical protein